MPDTKAEQIITMADHERSKAQNFMNLYQQVADLIYPIENQIIAFTTPGEDKSLWLRDPTGLDALDDATAGFIGTWIPEEKYYFGIKVKDQEVAELDHVKRWLAKATSIAHDEIFGSNYMLQLQMTIKSLLAFGTGCLFSEWDPKAGGLNYKDWHISTYTIKENPRGQVDTVILRYMMTARQATVEFSNPGREVTEAVKEVKNESKKFEFIHIVRPRLNRNVMFTNNTNMPFESVFVNAKEKIVVEEGGFEELPFAVSRWEKTSTEKYGRGPGTTRLAAIKELQQMAKDLLECANRWNRPPMEIVRNNIEGEVNMAPDGQNDVMEANSIRAIQAQALGSFPITKEILDDKRGLVKKGFYGDIFSQLEQLKGDRRTTVEIRERLKEGLRRLISPVARQESRQFTPHITRSILLLIRNGRIPTPPSELRGQAFGLEYLGELAMAMRDYHARAFIQSVGVVAELAPIFPEARDIINLGRALPNIFLNSGLRVEDLNTEEEIAAIQEARAKAQEKQEALEAIQAGATAYKDAGKAPEAGSASEGVQELVGA